MREVRLEDIRKLIGDVVGNDEACSLLNEHSALMGAIPELDSMAVVNLLLALEQRYGFHVEDDEIEVDIFETVGSLRDFAQHKLATM